MKYIKILLIGLLLFGFVIAQEVAPDTTVVNTIERLEKEYNDIADSYIENLNLQNSMIFTYREMVKIDMDIVVIDKLSVDYDSVGVLVNREKRKLDDIKYALDIFREHVKDKDKKE